MTGMSESQDLQELIKRFATDIGSMDSIVILGYSYGSLIASLHPPTLSLNGVHVVPVHRVFLSYPLSPRPFLTFLNGTKYDKALREGSKGDNDNRGRKLLIYGTRDQFTSANVYRSWVEPLMKSENLCVEVVDGADHFWRGESLHVLKNLVLLWLLGL